MRVILCGSTEPAARLRLQRQRGGRAPHGALHRLPAFFLAAARAAPPCCPRSCVAPLDLSSFLFLRVCMVHASRLSAPLRPHHPARAAKRMHATMRAQRVVRRRARAACARAWPAAWRQHWRLLARRASKAGAPCGRRWAPRRHPSATWPAYTFPANKKQNKKENRAQRVPSTLRFRKFPGKTEGVWCSILETRELTGSRTMRNRPYPVLKCSSFPESESCGLGQNLRQN